MSKFDLVVNRIDSLHFGNLNLGSAGGNTGQFVAEHLYMLIYGFTQVHTQFGNPVQFDTRVTFVGTETMTILSDELLDISSNDQSSLEGGITSRMRTAINEVLGTLNTIDYSSFVFNLTIFKLDINGNIIWSNSYWPPIELNRFEISNIIESPDMGDLCTGVTLNEGWTVQKTWLLKLDACGYEEPSDCPPVVSVGNGTEILRFNACPNPFHKQLKAQLPANTKRVDWLDATGRLIHSEKVYYPNQEWNLSALPIGVYHMQVVLEDGQVLSKRVVKE